MKKYVYHYNAIYSPKGGGFSFHTSFAIRDRKIDSHEAYSKLLDEIYENVKKYGCTGREKINITSLSFLHEVEI